jgi:hypothetical protein
VSSPGRGNICVETVVGFDDDGALAKKKKRKRDATRNRTCGPA